MVVVVRDEDRSGRVDSQPCATAESKLAVRRAGAPPFCDEGARRAEALDSVVRVSGVDVSRPVRGHVVDVVELPVAAAEGPELAQKPTAGSEPLDSPVHTIGDPYVARRVGVDPLREIELAVAGPRATRLAGGGAGLGYRRAGVDAQTPGDLESAARAEPLDSVVRAICRIDPPGGIDASPRGSLNWPPACRVPRRS